MSPDTRPGLNHRMNRRDFLIGGGLIGLGALFASSCSPAKPREEYVSNMAVAKCLAVLTGGSNELSEQDQAILDFVKSVTVRVKCSNGKIGTGVLLEGGPNTLEVATARHILITEDEGEIQKNDISIVTSQYPTTPFNAYAQETAINNSPKTDIAIIVSPLDVPDSIKRSFADIPKTTVAQTRLKLNQSVFTWGFGQAHMNEHCFSEGHPEVGIVTRVSPLNEGGIEYEIFGMNLSAGDSGSPLIGDDKKWHGGLVWSDGLNSLFHTLPNYPTVHNQLHASLDLPGYTNRTLSEDELAGIFTP